MRINMSLSGPVAPGLLAGVIYFVIAIETGTSFAASLIGGVVVAIVAIVIGFIFHAVFARRSESR
jgi:hypothetical protein